VFFIGLTTITTAIGLLQGLVQTHLRLAVAADLLFGVTRCEYLRRALVIVQQVWQRAHSNDACSQWQSRSIKDLLRQVLYGIKNFYFQNSLWYWPHWPKQRRPKSGLESTGTWEYYCSKLRRRRVFYRAQCALTWTDPSHAWCTVLYLYCTVLYFIMNRTTYSTFTFIIIKSSHWKSASFFKLNFTVWHSTDTV